MQDEQADGRQESGDEWAAAAEEAGIPTEQDFIEYAGFWRRVAASLIDTILLVIVLALLAIPLGFIGMPVMGGGMVGGILLQYVFPMVIVVALWLKFGATPGKQLLDCVIVDARSGHPLRTGQAILRYIGYYASSIPLLLGFVWVAWSPRKQGFHDYIAGTVVIHKAERHQDPEADKSIEAFLKDHQ
ncbi:MAG: RDD family protein [Gammaproteobacteria bacterium]|nr:RDD family protein [Gammaproteobacteria bacterium]